MDGTSGAADSLEAKRVVSSPTQHSSHNETPIADGELLYILYRILCMLDSDTHARMHVCIRK